jgi:hypothetical protein
MQLSGGSPDVPCLTCGKRVFGLVWGTDCPDCHARREARSSRLGSRVALGATVLMGLYVWLEMPAEPALGRIYGIVGVLATYVIVRRIVSRIAMEYLPR